MKLIFHHLEPAPARGCSLCDGESWTSTGISAVLMAETLSLIELCHVLGLAPREGARYIWGQSSLPGWSRSWMEFSEQKQELITEFSPPEKIPMLWLCSRGQWLSRPTENLGLEGQGLANARFIHLPS